MEKELFKAKNRQTGKVIVDEWETVSELDKRIWDVISANGNEPVWFKPKKRKWLPLQDKLKKNIIGNIDFNSKPWEGWKVFERIKNTPFQYLNESIAKYYTWNYREDIPWLKAA